MKTRYRAYILFLSLAYLCIILGTLFLPARKEATGKGLVIAEIRCGSYLGCGILYAVQDGMLIFAAPKHLLMNDVTVEIRLDVSTSENTGETQTVRMQGTVGPISMYEDLGFVLADSSALTIRQKNDLRYAVPAVSITEHDKVSGVVMDRNSGQTILEGTIISPLQFIPDVNTEVVMADFSIRQGMSGGALIDQSGLLVGMLIAGNEENTLALPVAVIQQTYLEQFGLKSGNF